MPKEETLLADRLCTGDKPSIITAGMLVAHALKKGKFAVLTQNVLGQIVILPPDVVKLPGPILLPDEALDEFEEDEALTLAIKEGRNEDDILAYLERRRARQEGSQPE
jgi:hypothetical protein